MIESPEFISERKSPGGAYTHTGAAIDAGVGVHFYLVAFQCESLNRALAHACSASDTGVLIDIYCHITYLRCTATSGDPRSHLSFEDI